MRILYADDDPNQRLYFGRAGERIGHEVVIVGDGAEAWDLVQRGECFDLIVSDHDMVFEGITPDRKKIISIIEWAYKNTRDNIFSSSSFLKNHGEELGLDYKTAGIIIYFVERTKREMMIWFRKEFDEHINWAGNPKKEIDVFLDNGIEKHTVSPRKSFEVFTENIKGSSKKWSSNNIISVSLIRDVILETSHKQYITIKKLNDQLKRVNEELDSFSYTISHDLGTPLTVMKLNAQMLLKSLGETAEKNKINSIIEEIETWTAILLPLFLKKPGPHLRGGNFHPAGQ